MMEDLGRVYSFLLTNRMIESHPRGGRFKTGEKAVAKILSENTGLLIELSDFLKPMGFEIQVWDETKAPGISRDGFVYLLVRSGLNEPPCFGEARFLEILRDGGSEARDVTAVWFLHLWLILSHLLYTSIRRSPSEVIRYNEASVTVQVLYEAIKEHIEKHREAGSPKTPQGGEVYRILTSHKGMELSRRTKKFLDGMCEAALLEEIKDEPGLYRQTLLGAVEFESMFNRTIAPFLVGDDINHLGTITDIVSGEQQQTSEGSMEGDV